MSIYNGYYPGIQYLRDKEHMFLLCFVMFRPSISATAPALPLTAADGQLGLQTGLIGC